MQLKSGSKGDDVVRLQKALNAFLASTGNALKLKEDGDFGTNTDKAVRAFQAASGLTVNGIADDALWAKLQGANPAAAPVTPSQPAGGSADAFSKVTAIVIAQLEGGYYHPDMNSPTGRLKKHYDYLDSSGETMFGIDRLNGIGDLGKNPAWDQFWGIIDKANARTDWAYNYRGGAYQDQLTKLAIAIMKPQFDKLCALYLKTNGNIVMSNNRLVFHFAYATWNGSGWFKKFAADIDKAVASGITTPDGLAQVAINSRTKEGLKPGSPPNSLLVQTGEKIKAIFETLK